MGGVAPFFPVFCCSRGASELIWLHAFPLLGFSPQCWASGREERDTWDSARFLCVPGTRGAGGVVLAFWVVSRHPTAPNCAIGPPCEHPGGARLRLGQLFFSSLFFFLPFPFQPLSIFLCDKQMQTRTHIHTCPKHHIPKKCSFGKPSAVHALT